MTDSGIRSVCFTGHRQIPASQEMCIRDSDGTVSHTQKGSLWKGPYHLPRCLMTCDTLLGRIAEGSAPASFI